ncbi:MAG: prolyl oligopeptidase family serine peptidase [Kangiellaceae bacterium]|nr:prolyl oligopeptidase family serine peptidase [Kangiellaceae bacterium]
MNVMSLILKSPLLLSLLLSSKLALANAPLPLDNFIADPNIIDAKISPDGEHIALIFNQNNSRFLVIRNLVTPGSPVTGMLEDPVVRPNAVQWANNERIIVSLLVPFETDKIRYKFENESDFDFDRHLMFTRSVSMDLNAKNMVQLMENKNHHFIWNIHLSSISNLLESDDKHVLMPAFLGNKYTLNKVNIYTGDATTIARANKRTMKIITDMQGEPLFRIDYLKRAKELQFYEFLGNNKWLKFDTIYFNPDDESGIDTRGLVRIGIENKGNLLYRKRNPETGFYEIVEYNRESKKTATKISLPDQSVHSIIVGSINNLVIGYRIQNDIVRAVYFDQTLQQKYDAIAAKLGPQQFYLLSSLEKAVKTTILTESLTNPGSIYTFDFKSSKLDYVGQRQSSLPLEQLAKSATSTYKTKDGSDIRAYILFPPGYTKDSRVPLVVLPHGGPNIRDTATFNRLAQFIATRGYAVIQPNFRGSVGFGREFEEQGYKQWGELMQSDLTDAVNYMVSIGVADASRICIVGASYGGYAALNSVVDEPELYQCAISINGISNIKDLIEHSIDKAGYFKETVRELVHRKVGHPEKDSELLDSNSPELHARKIKTPVLLIAGEDDKIVPVEQSEKMADALKKADRSYRYVEIEKIGHHMFRKITARKILFSEVENFLAQHLQ